LQARKAEKVSATKHLSLKPQTRRSEQRQIDAELKKKSYAERRRKDSKPKRRRRLVKKIRLSN